MRNIHIRATLLLRDCDAWIRRSTRVTAQLLCQCSHSRLRSSNTIQHTVAALQAEGAFRQTSPLANSLYNVVHLLLNRRQLALYGRRLRSLVRWKKEGVIIHPRRLLNVKMLFEYVYIVLECCDLIYGECERCFYRGFYEFQRIGVTLFQEKNIICRDSVCLDFAVEPGHVRDSLEKAVKSVSVFLRHFIDGRQLV